MRVFLVFTAVLGLGLQSVVADLLPVGARAFLEAYCLDCHDADLLKGGINLDVAEVNWAASSEQSLWERVHEAVKTGAMPPEKKSQPAAAERQQLVKWIDETLSRHITIGGTPARRLNQTEYRATIESLFGIKDFELSPGFPMDRELHGFDNLAHGLVLSPPLLGAYNETDQLVADRIFPPQGKVSHSVRLTAEAKDFAISYSSGKIVDGAMRLGMKSDPIFRSCTWPSRIEAPSSGIYTLSLDLSTFRPSAGAEPMLVKVYARDVESRDSIPHTQLRLLRELKVSSESPETFRFEAALYESQTPVIHWANATLDSDRDDKEELVSYFVARDTETPGYLAAWHAMVDGKAQGFRGGVGWDRVKALLAGESVTLFDESKRDALLKRIRGNPVLYAETVVFEIFEQGPALELHRFSMEGPHRLVEGPRDRERRRLRAIFTGGNSTPTTIIRDFLTRAFRRTVDEETVSTYLQLHDRHLESGRSADEAMHLVIRNALISPRFLYRCLSDGPLDDHDLGTRLAYFLTGAPPDEKLRTQANSGSLRDPTILQAQAERLLPGRASAALCVNFTSQWLDTRLLSEIMPDAKFKFTANDEKNARLEVEHFFFTMLSENRPLTDFIDPDFTWTSGRLAKNVYGLKTGFDKKKANAIHRISFPRGGRFGGVLGQSAVMMATANGVDTQPVLRGVWVLENILGQSPPPPPNSVPALTPDTTGTRNPRELLSAHTEESSCAGCHRHIDPLGFMLENFDPVGRWRDEWPGTGQSIDASSVLADGTQIHDITDFKTWLVGRIDLFAQCLSEKLITYATGRVPNYSERKEISRIIKENLEEGRGFRDLLLSLIASESFCTK